MEDKSENNNKNNQGNKSDPLYETGYDIDLELIKRQRRSGHKKPDADESKSVSPLAANEPRNNTAPVKAAPAVPNPVPNAVPNPVPNPVPGVVNTDGLTRACDIVHPVPETEINAVGSNCGEHNKSTDNSGGDINYDADGTCDGTDDGTDADNGDAVPRKRGANAIVGLIKGVVYIVSVIVIGVALAIFAVIPIGNDIFALQKEEKVVDITIPELATLSDVTDILAENGLIEYPRVFKIYAGFIKDDGVFIAGDYTVSTTQNYRQLLESFKPSADIEIVSITIPEGLTTDEIIDLFVSKGIGTREGFVEAINNYNWAEEYSFWFVDELMENGISEDRFYRLDGYLYPDTYLFYTNSSEVSAIAKLLANFDAKFSETYRNYINSHGFTVDEIITLASMVECEARYLSEFSLVSSVFHNRLKHSSSYPYLESDATIMYAIFHDTGERPEKLTGTDYDSPYNTYDYRGLPPGPISNPGFNAITYAIYPRVTDYYYFVANNDGYSVFSETLGAHQAAIRAVADGTAISTIMQGSSSAEYQE